MAAILALDRGGFAAGFAAGRVLLVRRLAGEELHVIAAVQAGPTSWAAGRGRIRPGSSTFADVCQSGAPGVRADFVAAEREP